MKAVFLESHSTARLRQTPTPEPDEREALIRVGTCGICGSDLHLEAIKRDALPYPFIPGHEATGTVVEVGDKVDRLRPGDHVVVQPLVACGSCRACRKGNVNLCHNPQILGVHRPGGFAEYLVAPAANLYECNELADAAAACTEPLACALHGFNRLGVRAGDRALLLGAGGLGLLFLQLLRGAGACPVTVVDLHRYRLEVATQLGADHTVRVQPGQELPPATAMPTAFDCVVDATGVPSVVEASFQHIQPSGKLLMLGSYPTGATISIQPRRIQSQDVSVVGSMGFGFQFLPALRLLQEGRVNTDAIVTHRYGLSDFSAALAQARSGEESVKVQIAPN